MNNWSFEARAQEHRDEYHSITDQMFNEGNRTRWSHEAFLTLPAVATQNMLFNRLSEAQATLLKSLVPRP